MIYSTYLPALVLAIAVSASTANAQTVVYRCKDASGAITITDSGCRSVQDSVRQDIVTAPSASPNNHGNSANDNYARYLQMKERERAELRAAQERSFADISNAPTYAEREAAENRDRRVRSCMHDQRVDEARSGRARYTCDSESGQKILPPKLYVGGGNRNNRYITSNGLTVEEGQPYRDSQGNRCKVFASIARCDAD